MVGADDARRQRWPSSGSKKLSTPRTQTDWQGRNLFPKLTFNAAIALTKHVVATNFLFPFFGDDHMCMLLSLLSKVYFKNTLSARNLKTNICITYILVDVVEDRKNHSRKVPWMNTQHHMLCVYAYVVFTWPHSNRGLRKLVWQKLIMLP